MGRDTFGCDNCEKVFGDGGVGVCGVCRRDCGDGDIIAKFLAVLKLTTMEVLTLLATI